MQHLCRTNGRGNLVKLNWRYVCNLWTIPWEKFWWFCHFFKILKKSPGQISFPLHFRHTITVQPAKREGERMRIDTPPGSPAIQQQQRLIAIASKFLKWFYTRFLLRNWHEFYLWGNFVDFLVNFPLVHEISRKFSPNWNN